MDITYWSNLLFIICWITGWVYLVRLYVSYPKKFEFWKKGVAKAQWVNLVAILGLFFAPFIWVNFHQEKAFYDYKRHYDKIMQDGNSAKIYEFHEAAIQKYPYNSRVNIEFLLYSARSGKKTWLLERAAYYEDQIGQGNDVEKYQLLAHLGSIYSGLSAFKYEHGPIENEELIALSHFLEAEIYFEFEDHIKAQEEFLLVLKDEELADVAYQRLDELWYHHFTFEEVSKMAYNMDVFPFMPFGLKNEIYKQDRSWGWYLFNGIYRDFLSADLAAYIAVGFALGLWLLFIYQILYIKPDKWKYIILLFLLGATLPVLVYVLTDLLEYAYSELGIYLDHGNLIYCVVNIGMVEELVKTIPWLIIYFLYKSKFHRPVHFMLLPIVSALGFAFSENLIYVNSNDYELVFARSAISLIMHVACSAIIGYMAWRSNLKRRTIEKLGIIFLGFVIASFLHGFFDFILFVRMGYLYILVLLISLHLLILFINNAINFSGIRNKFAVRQLKQSGAILLVGLIAVFLLQYVIIGWIYSPGSANVVLRANVIFVLITIIYLVATFSKIKLRPRVLYKFSVADVFGQFLTTSKGNYMDEVDYEHCEFKLFAPKSNPFVGAQMPVKATALKRVVIQNDMRWWLIEFNKDLLVTNTHPRFGVIKAKESDQDLFMDKVEVILFMIPNYEEFQARKKHHSKDFVYTDRVYSRPTFVAVK